MQGQTWDIQLKIVDSAIKMGLIYWQDGSNQD